MLADLAQTQEMKVLGDAGNQVKAQNEAFSSYAYALSFQVTAFPP